MTTRVPHRRRGGPRRAHTGLLAAGLALATACTTVGPDYVPPEVPEPEQFRGAENTEVSFADRSWDEIFRDPVLQELIRTALAENYDVRVAAERVLQARAQLTIVDARNYPQLDASAQQTWLQASKNTAFPPPAGISRDQRQTTIGLSLSWQLDFWGQFDRATEAARAQLFSSEYARVFIIQTLVSDIAAAYYELLQLDAQLAISHESVDSRVESTRLVQLRLDQGVSNKVELRQSENLVYTAQALVPDLEQRIEQQENFIKILVGGLPGPVPRGEMDLESDREIDVPVGLPSQLLQRRPDVLQAEQRLVAANARIGVARALLYPNITLTAFGGGASEDLDKLFESGSTLWDVTPSILMPIFNAGRLQANVEFTESQQRQIALQYQQTLQEAFRDVADALIAYEKTRELRLVRTQVRDTLDDQLRLSRERYRGGVTSYLEVLDTERDHFDAELSLAEAIRDELLSTVALYRALGGGWQGALQLAANGPQPVPNLDGTMPDHSALQNDGDEGETTEGAAMPTAAEDAGPPPPEGAEPAAGEESTSP